MLWFHVYVPFGCCICIPECVCNHICYWLFNVCWAGLLFADPTDCGSICMSLCVWLFSLTKWDIFINNYCVLKTYFVLFKESIFHILEFRY